MKAKYRIGIDVGGTFTDLVAYDENDGGTLLSKIPSTPRDPSQGVIGAFKHLMQTRQGEVRMLVHASTVGTNLFLGQIGLDIPKGALVTTSGFKDILEIGRQKRNELYNPFFQRPKPLIERHLRFTLHERIDFKGQVLQTVDREETRMLARRIRQEGAETVAVVFLNSYINPQHERAVKEVLQQELPDTVIMASHEVDPEYREYERTSTTVINSLLTPVLSRYLEKIERELKELGVGAAIYVMQSNGGVATIETASKIPAATIESGPATGVTAASYWSRMLGIRNVLSFDMGGTTAKAGAVIDGMPQMVSEYEIGGRIHSGRLVKGSGYPVRFAFIDLAEVSGGGGTMAWVEQGSLMRVGPLSAGAVPGPACYGKGGENPTVTDANLVLGRLGSKALPGIEILPELAEKALEEKIARPLGVSLVQAASGVLEIVNSHMMRALRLVSIERGYDPRGFTMLAFGGAGPMHAPFLAEGLGINKVLIPPNPGVFSALGLILADFRHDFVRSIMKQATDLEPEALNKIFEDIENEASTLLRKEGFRTGQTVLERKLDLRYLGQSYEITVPVQKGLAFVLKSFHLRHREIYGYASKAEPIEIVNVRLVASGITDKPGFKQLSGTIAARAAEASLSKRKVFFGDTGWIEAAVYARQSLLPGAVIEEPAIIEQYDATTVIPSGWNAYIDETLNLILTRGSQNETRPGNY